MYEHKSSKNNSVRWPLMNKLPFSADINYTQKKKAQSHIRKHNKKATTNSCILFCSRKRQLQVNFNLNRLYFINLVCKNNFLFSLPSFSFISTFFFETKLRQDLIYNQTQLKISTRPFKFYFMNISQCSQFETQTCP